MLYTDELLDSLRGIADPVPDQLVDQLAERHTIGTVSGVLHHLLRNAQPIPDELPPDVADWLRTSGALPGWSDRRRIERAAHMFATHGPTICLILSTSSLLEAYAAHRGVKVLAFTYRLSQDVYRRVAETAQFVLTVLAPGGLYADGGGIPAILKVRLMHAAIRRLIRQTGRWPDAELGVPICQEDLLGTLMTFSYVVVRDLPKLDIRISDQDGEDYLYFWRVVGELLGVRAEYIPPTLREARVLFEAIQRRHQAPSAEGARFARGLLEFHRALVPSHLFQRITPAVMRHLAGDRICDWLEVPRNEWQVLLHDGVLLGDWAAIANRWGEALVGQRMLSLTGYERAAFDIPTKLGEVWDVQRPGWNEAWTEGVSALE